MLLQREQVVVLVFEIEHHRYGVDTERVLEIVRAVQPIRLPKAPPVVIGPINVRGQVIPLFDLRRRFGLRERALSSDEVFVIASARGQRCALRADAVSELLGVSRASIVPAPERSELAAGTAVLEDGLLMICDLDAFLDDAERAQLEHALGEAAP